MDYKTAKGMLRPEEREALVAASSRVQQEDAIINIGIEYGASMVCLATGYHGNLLIGVDLDLTKLSWELKDELAGKAVFLMGNSHQRVVTSWIERTLKANLMTVGLAFIDGDHYYEGVLADATMYGNMVKVGGEIIFHDCYDWDYPERRSTNDFVEGVGRAVDTWYDNFGEQWKDIGKVGTMRMFRRLRWINGQG